MHIICLAFSDAVLGGRRGGGRGGVGPDRGTHHIRIRGGADPGTTGAARRRPPPLHHQAVEKLATQATGPRPGTDPARRRTEPQRRHRREPARPGTGARYRAPCPPAPAATGAADDERVRAALFVLAGAGRHSNNCAGDDAGGGSRLLATRAPPLSQLHRTGEHAVDARTIVRSKRQARECSRRRCTALPGPWRASDARLRRSGDPSQCWWRASGCHADSSRPRLCGSIRSHLLDRLERSCARYQLFANRHAMQCRQPDRVTLRTIRSADCAVARPVTGP